MTSKSKKVNSKPAENSLIVFLKEYRLSNNLGSSEAPSLAFKFAYKKENLNACRLLLFHLNIAPIAKSFGAI